MAHKTFLELVNDAIAESKTSLEPLTSGDFGSPPRSILYNLFKQWVNRAYKEVLIERNEWYYRVERATARVYPRLQLRMVGVNVLNIGDTLVGDSSNVELEILDIHTAEDVENDTTTEYTVSVQYTDGASGADSLIFNETLSRTSSPAVASLCSVKGRGRYDLNELVPYIYKVDENSFAAQAANATASSELFKLAYISDATHAYNTNTVFELFSATSGKPLAIVKTADGNYDFYPRINEAYDLSFDFSQQVKLMSAYNDTPVLLDEKYCDLIMWKAISSYADWDERPKLFSRALKNIRNWKYIMDRDELPTLSLDTNRFYHG